MFIFTWRYSLAFSLSVKVFHIWKSITKELHKVSFVFISNIETWTETWWLNVSDRRVCNCWKSVLCDKSKAFSSDDDSRCIFCLSMTSVLYWSLCVRQFPLSTPANVLCFVQLQDPGKNLFFCLFSWSRWLLPIVNAGYRIGLLSLLVIQLCPTLCDPMDCAHQAPLSMGFSKQAYWSGLPFHSPGDLPNPGIEPTSLMSPEDGTKQLEERWQRWLLENHPRWEAKSWSRGEGETWILVKLKYSGRLGAHVPDNSHWGDTRTSRQLAPCCLYLVSKLCLSLYDPM